MSDLHDAIERAIKEHCAGGDLWLCANIASKPFDARIAELERECLQWGVEMRIYRETENSRIAELEQSVTVRDTEVARLETDLELARRDGERWRKLRAMNWTQKDALAVVHVRDLRLGTLTFTHDRLDLAVDARAGNGGGV